MNDRVERVENQVLATKLLNGTATQSERDQALATVMLSLWGQSELRSLIRLVHSEECNKCVFKKRAAGSESADSGGAAAWKKLSLTLLQYLGWVILIVAGLLKISVKG